MDDSMDISIVVISYNSADFLEKNLDSLLSQSPPFSRIVIVDNCSSDNSRDIVDSYREKHASIRLVTPETNTGYTGGANLGIAECDSRLVMVANADIILDKNFTRAVGDTFAADPDLALLSPLLLRFDKQTVDSAGQTYSRALYPREIGFNRPLSQVDVREKEIFSVCGAATVFRRTALETLEMDGQYYDEDFFIFWEDFDIGWRAHLLGLKTRLQPRAVVYHFRSATLERNFWSRFSLALARPSFIKYHLVKNRYLTLVKNFRFKQFYWTLPYIIFKDLIWVGLLTFRSPKIIIPLMKSMKYVKRAFARRKKLKAMIEDRTSTPAAPKQDECTR